MTCATLLQVHGVLGQTYSAMLRKGPQDARPEVCSPVWGDSTLSASWRRSSGSVAMAVPLHRPLQHEDMPGSGCSRPPRSLVCTPVGRAEWLPPRAVQLTWSGMQALRCVCRTVTATITTLGRTVSTLPRASLATTLPSPSTLAMWSGAQTCSRQGACWSSASRIIKLRQQNLHKWQALQAIV